MAHVELLRLISFFANPVRYLLRERLGILLEYQEKTLRPGDPFALDYFEQDRIGNVNEISTGIRIVLNSC